MRTQLELWKIVDENFNEHFEYGLCNLLFDIYISGVIDSLEYLIIRRELMECGNSGDYFLGECGDPKPRKEFIKKMIEKHERK